MKHYKPDYSDSDFDFDLGLSNFENNTKFNAIFDSIKCHLPSIPHYIIFIIIVVILISISILFISLDKQAGGGLV